MPRATSITLVFVSSIHATPRSSRWIWAAVEGSIRRNLAHAIFGSNSHCLPIPRQNGQNVGGDGAGDRFPRWLGFLAVNVDKAHTNESNWSSRVMALPPPPPLRTGRESFPSSGSSRYKASPEVKPVITTKSCDLYDTGLQPPDLTLGPVRGRTHEFLHVHLLFLSRRFHRFSRNDRPCRKSARLRGGVMLQLLSARLQGGIGFLQRSVAPHLISLPCGQPSSKRRNEGFTTLPSDSE